MARIRTIKPEFWGDEKLAPLPDATRLVFLALISMADDLGRLVDNERLIDAFIFPDEGRLGDTREALASLSRLSRITRGRTESGQAIIQIVNWERHQRVDRPSLKSCLPEIVEEQEVVEPRATLAEDSRESREDLAPRPTTNDLRPTTDDRRAGTAREDLAAASTTAAEGFASQVPEPYREAVLASFRGSHNPRALLQEFEAIVSGMHPPAYDHATIGRAVHELAVAGTPVRSVTLRAFCRRIVAEQVPAGAAMSDEELFRDA